jgi:hypothetical protein
MIKIYCLADPRDNKPFYVGATTNTKSRLTGHINQAKFSREKAEMFDKGNAIRFFPFLQKAKLICDILDAGFKPTLSVLYFTDKKSVQYHERFFCEMFINQGFDLKQEIDRKYPSPQPPYKKISKSIYLLKYSQD